MCWHEHMAAELVEATGAGVRGGCELSFVVAGSQTLSSAKTVCACNC